MSQVIRVSSEQFDSTQQSDYTGTPWQPCSRGEITDNLAAVSGMRKMRNAYFLVFRSSWMFSQTLAMYFLLMA